MAASKPTAQGLLEEFESRHLVPRLFDVAFQHVAFAIYGPPRVMSNSIDYHDDLAEVPLSTAGLHPLNAALADLRGENWAKPQPPVVDRFVTHVDPALVQHIFDVPQLQRNADIHHNR